MPPPPSVRPPYCDPPERILFYDGGAIEKKGKFSKGNKLDPLLYLPHPGF